MASCYDNVPAPTDANGCVVPPDTKELVRKGETLEVYGFDYSVMLKAWFVMLEEYGYTRLGACTLPDSWERLDEDVRKTPREEREKGTKMAKISDEIREWVRRALADEHMDLRELDALADRVDKELVEMRATPMAVEIGTVQTFDNVKPDKAQALKVLEEAAEVFGAWQKWQKRPCDDERGDVALLDECADVIQATCNLIAALGVGNFAGSMRRCKKRNVVRGRISR